MEVMGQVPDQTEVTGQAPEKITNNPGNGKLQPLVDHCLKLYDEYGGTKPNGGSQYRKDKIKEITESRMCYEQRAEKITFPWPDAANWVLPLLMITVDNLEPRLVAGLIGRDPYVKFEPVSMGTQRGPEVDILEDWWNKELKNVVKLETVAMTATHNLLLEGTIYPLPRYELDEVTRADYVFDKDGKIIIDPKTQAPQTQEVKDTVFEGGQVDFIPFTDVFCADDIGTEEQWEKADKIINVSYTYADLMRKQGKFGWQNIGPWLVPEKAKRKLVAEDRSPTEDVGKLEITGKENIECIQCHISYPMNRDMDAPEEDQIDFEEDFIIVTLTRDSKTIIRMVRRIDVYMKNNSILRRVRLFPEEGRSFGTSMYGKMRAIQLGASQLTSRMSDCADVGLIPFFFYDDTSGLKGDVQVQPGKGVKVENVKGILFPTFQIDPRRYMPLIEFLITMWERIGSIGDWQIGMTNQEGGKRTAHEVNAVLQEGQIKHNYQAKTTKEEFLSVIKTLYDLYYEYMPVDSMWQYGGKQVPIPRAAMRTGNKFILSGSTEMANKAVDRADARQLMMDLGQDPLMNLIKLREDLLKTYGKTETQEYINPNIGGIVKAIEQFPQMGQALTVIAGAMAQHPELGQVLQEDTQAYIQEKQNAIKLVKGQKDVGSAVQ